MFPFSFEVGLAHTGMLSVCSYLNIIPFETRTYFFFIICSQNTRSIQVIIILIRLKSVMNALNESEIGILDR